MNNLTPGEAMSITNPSKLGNKRKKGQLAKEIIQLIVERPDLSLNEIANKLECTHENIRLVFKKIKETPDEHAVRSGCDQKALREALMRRKETVNIVTRKIKTPWRGKANWPASIVAKKKNISTRQMLPWIMSVYAMDTEKQRYICTNPEEAAGIAASISFKTFEDVPKVYLNSKL